MDPEIKKRIDPWLKDGGPAFPSETETGYYGGMTLRDWFAGQALAGSPIFGDGYESAAKRAYEYADAMLAERERKS